MTHTKDREKIAAIAKSLFDRGLTSGSSGNISQRVEDGWLMTPTGSSMGDLDPERISFLDAQRHHVSGDAPTKESFLHFAFYDQRPKAEAVVHLHATYSVAVSCLDGVNKDNVLPPLTPYYVMRIGTLPLIRYFAPGNERLADEVRDKASDHHAVLLANHGPVVAGKSLQDAVYAIEELEETAKLFLALQGMKTNPLTTEQIADLNARFPKLI